MPCEFCGAPNTIQNSHVVSDFVIQFLLQNSVARSFFNTRQNQQFNKRGQFAQWMITGPYLCQLCDNNVFGGWENAFSGDVFHNPLAATHVWGRDTSLRFLVSICYRYAIHSLVVDPDPAHVPIAVLFRDLCKTALNDLSQLGSTLFVYPCVYQPITARCDVQPGINHLLTMTLSDRLRQAEGGLPNRYVIQLPRIMLLFSESDLTTTGNAGYAQLHDLRPGTTFAPATSNLQLLNLYADLLNEGIDETKGHQSATNRWFDFVRLWDQTRYPNKLIYHSARADWQLAQWQRNQC
jgi:hypothetical protein